MAKDLGTVTLNWSNPYTYDNRNVLPKKKSGVYMVISGNKNNDGKWSRSTYKLLDIGQTGDFHDRFNPSHGREKCWDKEVPEGHTILIKIAEMDAKKYDEDDRRIVECCLRARNNPPCGEECECYTKEDKVIIKNEGLYPPLIKDTQCLEKEEC